MRLVTINGVSVMSDYNKQAGFDAMKRAEYDFDRARAALKTEYRLLLDESLRKYDRELERIYTSGAENFEHERRALISQRIQTANQLMLDHDKALEQLRAAYDNQCLLIRRAA